MGEWRWSGDNPIVRAAIGIDFVAPFQPATIHDASLKHRVLRQMLPRKMDQRPMVQFGQMVGSPIPVPMPMGQAPWPGGFSFDKTDDTGKQIKVVSMFGNLLVFSSAAYTRWDKVWPEAQKVFSELLPIIDDSGNLVTNTTLEYVNQAYWSGDPETADIQSLLSDGPFVCPNALRVSGLWHNFHGFFRDAEGSLPGRYLENINLSVRDGPDPQSDSEVPLRWVDIAINHRFILTTPTSFIPSENRPAPDLAQHVTFMHERNKAILREILHDSIISRIPGLGAV